MPDRTMSAAEFAVIRHTMGHTLDSLARRMKVNPRTVRSWESGRDAISASAAGGVNEILAEHTELVDDMLKRGRVSIPRDPENDPPRGWYVAAAARALQAKPDLEVEWETDGE